MVRSLLWRQGRLAPQKAATVYDLDWKERYGVLDRHYDTVGSALIWTLEKGLGSAFTAEVRLAWTTLYGLLASTMARAAASEGSAA